MRTKLNGILTLLLAFVVHLSFAQEKTITGNVTDQDGLPLPGVNIVVEGTINGAQTDFNGNYSISASEGQALLFSYVGQERYKSAVGASNILNVQMQEDAQALEEVVVTAQGIKRNKRSLGYAQQTIDSDELITSKQSDIVNSMAGKIAGIQIMSAPKSGFNQSQIRLRGSIDVLYVVDGIRLQTSDDINPEDVSSMSVLKGSAATALYGPEGRNGVVIIVTNKAKNGDAIVRYDGSVEVGYADYIHDLQSEYGGGYSQTFSQFSFNASKDPASWSSFDGDNIVEYSSDESWGPKLDGRLVRQWDSWIPSNPNFGKSTPWVSNGGLSDYFTTSFSTKHSFTFLKGGEDYNLKLNLLRNDRTLNVDNSKRANTRVSFSGDFDVSPKFKVSTNIAYQDRSTLNNPAEGYGSIGANVFQWWQAQLDIDKLKDYRQNGSIVSWNIKGPRDPTPKFWDSPYFETRENLKHASRKSLIGNIALNYKLNDFFSTKIVYNKTFELRKFDSRVAWEGLDTPSFNESNWTKDRNLFTGQLSYNQDFESFTFSAHTGIELDQLKYEITSASTKNGLTIPGFYNIKTSKERPDYEHYFSHKKGSAVYFTGTIGYKNTLFFDGSLRKDWSSTAKIGDNSVFTKGATLSFIFSELIPKNNFFTYGKLRGGIAQGPKFPGTYALSETYGIRNSYGSRPVLSVSNTIFNTDLVGGIRKEIEFGTELRFLKNRLEIDLTYFSKTDTDLPTSLSLDPTTGYTRVLVNSGEETYKGIEVAFRGTPIISDDFSWKTSFNFATLERRVVKLAEGLNQTNTGFLISRWGGLLLRDKEGEKWGEVYGRKVKEINGKKVISSTANYVTEDDQSLGNYLPEFTGGFINSFKYKNFSLNIDMDYQVGGKYFSITQMFINSSGLGEATVGNNKLGNPLRDPVINKAGETGSYVAANDAGIKSGGQFIEGVDEKGNNVSYYVNPKRYWGSQFGNSSEFIYDASYLSIRNIRLGYSFPNKLIEKTGIRKFSISIYVNNAFLLFSSLPNIDPSQLEQKSEDINFMEGGQLPGVRTYGLNIKMTL